MAVKQFFRFIAEKAGFSLRENYGFRPAELARIESELKRHVGRICQEWERIHGSD